MPFSHVLCGKGAGAAGGSLRARSRARTSGPQSIQFWRAPPATVRPPGGLPIGNLINRAIGVVAALAALGPVSRLMVVIEPDNTRAVADFHTAFNLLLALIFLPLLKPYALLAALTPGAGQSELIQGRPVYLDPAARDTPIVALGGAARGALRLADVLEAMLAGLREAFDKGDRRQIGETKRLDDILDKLNASIKAYITAINPDALSDEDHRRARELLAFTINLEHAGDIVEKNLLGIVTKKLKRGVGFRRPGQAGTADPDRSASGKPEYGSLSCS